MEKVLCALIWVDDGKFHLHQPHNIKTGFVVSGWRHGSVFASLKAMGCTPPIRLEYQGFLTSNNRFLNRLEAVESVKETGQCNPEFDDELYSEDLY